MGNLLFWLGIGAAQKGAGSKPIERRHWVASLIVGILVALLIAVGMFFLLVSQQFEPLFASGGLVAWWRPCAQVHFLDSQRSVT
jgi:hypothetical protein